MGGQQKNRRRGLKARWKQRMSFVLTALGHRKRGVYTPHAYGLDAFYDLGPYPAVKALFETARPTISSFIDGIPATIHHCVLQPEDIDRNNILMNRFFPTFAAVGPCP